jgi:hypothetical protein
MALHPAGRGEHVSGPGRARGARETETGTESVGDADLVAALRRRAIGVYVRTALWTLLTFLLACAFR